MIKGLSHDWKNQLILNQAFCIRSRHEPCCNVRTCSNKILVIVKKMITRQLYDQWLQLTYLQYGNVDRCKINGWGNGLKPISMTNAIINTFVHFLYFLNNKK
ncbi:hypothetical protein Hanom_Chr08g00735481 [Helianthus anomalus]